MTKIKVLQTEEKLWIKESVNNTKNTVFYFWLEIYFRSFWIYVSSFCFFLKTQKKKLIKFLTL